MKDKNDFEAWAEYCNIKKGWRIIHLEPLGMKSYKRILNSKYQYLTNCSLDEVDKIGWKTFKSIDNLIAEIKKVV